MSEQKICKDCKHFELFEVPGFESIYLCNRNEKVVSEIDIVTGEVTTYNTGVLSCYKEREFICVEVEGLCGYKGKYWEPKE